MTFVRNNVEIEGIDKKVNNFNNSYVLTYSENGTIFVPRSKGKIKYLNKVIIEMDSVEGKIINTPAGNILSIYGRKIYSLIYSEKSHDKTQKTLLNLPFIAYVHLPIEVNNFCNLNVSVVDAFFEVIDNRKIYNHVLYIIKFDKKEIENNILPSEKNENSYGQLTLSDLEKMIMASPLKDVFSSGGLIQGATPEGITEGDKKEEESSAKLINEGSQIIEEEEK